MWQDGKFGSAWARNLCAANQFRVTNVNTNRAFDCFFPILLFVFVLPSGNSGLQGMYRPKISKDVVVVHTVNILQFVVHLKKKKKIVAEVSDFNGWKHWDVLSHTDFNGWKYRDVLFSYSFCKFLNLLAWAQLLDNDRMLLRVWNCSQAAK